jgi:hypothetical protein
MVMLFNKEGLGILDFGFWILRLKSRGGSRSMCFSQDGFWIV